jgi:uncharacterized protein YcfJ
MRMTRNAVLLGSILTVAACGRGDVPPPDKLSDLTWMDTLTFPLDRQAAASAVELGLVEEEPAAPAPVAAAPRPAPRPAAQRSSAPRQTAARQPQRNYPAPAPQRTVSNAKRDAAIGAGAGAVIGATVAGNGNRVRGAIVGGAVGGVAGAVIGHTVDRKKVPN